MVMIRGMAARTTARSAATSLAHSRLHQQLRLRGPGEPGHQQGRARAVRAQHQHVAHVRVGRAGLGVQVVAVVPDGEQSQPRHRGEHRRAGADDHRHLPPTHRQPAPVAFGRTEIGTQRHHRVGPDPLRAGGQQGLDVALVGYDEQRAAPGHDRRRRGLGEPLRPRLPRQRLPDRVRGPPAGQRIQQSSAAGIPPPALARSGFHGRRGPLRRPLGLDPGMPGRHGQPQHVRENPGVPVGHRPAQRSDLGGEHRFGRHHPVDPGQLPLMGGLGNPLQHEPVHHPTGEPDPDADAGDRGLGELGGHPVVERPVEVGQGHVHDHACHRQLRSSLPLPPAPRRTGAGRGRRDAGTHQMPPQEAPGFSRGEECAALSAVTDSLHSCW
jgi:hypothetical protein